MPSASFSISSTNRRCRSILAPLMLIFPIAPSPDLAGEESSYASRAGVFSATETREIVSKLDANRWRVAEVGRQGEIDNSYRSANIQWLQPAQYAWIFERVA